LNFLTRLKTKGYCFDHNYGHGKQHLANLLAGLILLAFLASTLLDLYDPRDRQRAREPVLAARLRRTPSRARP